MPELDSEHTLVLTFGGSDFAGDQKEINFLVLKSFELTSGDLRGAWLFVLLGSAVVGLVSAAFGVRRFLDV